jgi:peptidoglycan/xylan/chitin deacetylase (PgdA/CDA1 family)
LTLNEFNNHLQYLKEHNFVIVSASKLLKIERLSAYNKYIVITFDDGWVGNYLFAYPLLKEFGFKATFFISPQLIGKEGYLTWDQLREMSKNGMDIQSHGLSHKPLGTLSREELETEILQSKEVIKNNTGVNVSLLSLPHGSKSLYLNKILEINYFKACFSSDINLYVPEKADIFNIGRMAITSKIKHKHFIKIVRGDYFYWTQEKAIRGVKIIIKRIIYRNKGR